MNSPQVIEIFNRSERPLTVRKDGLSYDIPPGRSHLRADLLRFAKNQHPVPGTDDGVAYESLISVVAPKGQPQVDPLDSLPNVVLDNLSVERIDRSALEPIRQAGTTLTFRKTPASEARMAEVTDGIVDPGRF